MNNDFAPVIIPTLNRYNHLRRCVESLARCTHAEETELIIGLDYPPSEKYEEGWRMICEYLPSITGFKKVTILKRDHNLGAVENMNSLFEYVETYSERYIFTEDDNEFSTNFLVYMNKGLEKYMNKPQVYSISGYNFPIDMQGYDKNIWASYRFSAWGCGFWKSKRLKISKNELLRFVFNPVHFFKILYFLPLKVFTLPVMLSRHDVYGDSCYEIYCCVNRWVSIFPTVSKVRNWGRDGSGLHGQTDETDPCYNQEIDSADFFEFDEIELVNVKNQELNRYYSRIVKNAILRHLKFKS